MENRLSITAAAELAGVSRNTIYQYKRTGKLSVGMDTASGQPYIDVTELLRVFPNIKMDSRTNKPKRSVTTPLNSDGGGVLAIQQQAEIDVLKAQLEAARVLLKEKDERIQELKEGQQDLRKSLKLLEDKTKKRKD